MRREEPVRSRTVADHFDDEARSGRWSALYATVDPRTYQFHVRRERVLELLPAQLGRIVDVGCGTGILAGHLVRRGGSYIGLDLAPAMIEEARRRYADVGGVTFGIADVERLPFPSSSVDQIVCLAVIEYLADPRTALGEIARVLRPGGVAVVSSPRRITLERAMLLASAPVRRAARTLVGRMERAVARKTYEPAQLGRYAVQHGLVMTACSLYYLTPIPYPITRLVPRLAMRLNLSFERLHRSESPLAGLLAQGFVARFERPT